MRVAISSQGSTSEVTFSDTGPGIPEDVRARIFTPFFTTKSRGSGLGLPTAKRLVEAHHGTITIECPPAGGTRYACDSRSAECHGPILEPGAWS